MSEGVQYSRRRLTDDMELRLSESDIIKINQKLIVYKINFVCEVRANLLVIRKRHATWVQIKFPFPY